MGLNSHFQDDGWCWGLWAQPRTLRGGTTWLVSWLVLGVSELRWGEGSWDLDLRKRQAGIVVSEETQRGWSQKDCLLDSAAATGKKCCYGRKHGWATPTGAGSQWEGKGPTSLLVISRFSACTTLVSNVVFYNIPQSYCIVINGFCPLVKRLTNYNRCAIYGCLSVFMNWVLLEYSHAHLFTRKYVQTSSIRHISVSLQFWY